MIIAVTHVNTVITTTILLNIDQMDLFATNYININRKKRKRIKNKDSSLKITYTKDSKVEQARLIK